MHDELPQTRKTYSLSNLQGLTPLALKGGTLGNCLAYKDTWYVYPRRSQTLGGTYSATLYHTCYPNRIMTIETQPPVSHYVPAPVTKEECMCFSFIGF